MPEITPLEFSDEFVDAYDLLIDWPKRLANEGPFFKKLFGDFGVKRVLDSACGTGHHANLFYHWGLTVEGADISPAMIRRCRDRFGEQDRLHWVTRSFERSSESMERFDAVICVGNSLALVTDFVAAERAIASLFAALRRGGVGVVQVLNLWAVPEGPTRWQKCKRVRDRRVILKGLHRVGGRGFIDLVDLRPDEGEPRFDTPSFLGIEAENLSAAICSNGGRSLRLYGGYQEEPYHREQSMDLICVFQA